MIEVRQIHLASWVNLQNIVAVGDVDSCEIKDDFTYSHNSKVSQQSQIQSIEIESTTIITKNCNPTVVLVVCHSLYFLSKCG